MEYIVNERGERMAVILTLEEYERLVEAVEDLEDAREHERVMAAVRTGTEELIPLRRALDG
jgi:PHD/YefM family antitoxin component YafN of YafNO toxin-antitoxin module